jgi:hypothetical protein
MDKVKLLPIVVTTVLEKKRDWPKLQLGSPDAFLAAETPLLLALTTSSISLSRSSSMEENSCYLIFTCHHIWQ